MSERLSVCHTMPAMLRRVGVSSRSSFINNKSIVLMAISLMFVSFMFIAYICPQHVCQLNSWTSPDVRYIARYSQVIRDNMGMPLSRAEHPSNYAKMSFDDMLSDESFEFDIKGNDVIVFLHIQKTGGTIFGRHLVHDLDLEKPCQCKRGRKKCKCVRPHSNAKYWLFSRYSTGWKCGLHADFTELTNCVDNALDESEKQKTKRRYFYITLLREPVSRFLSEYRHVQRGATWKSSRHWCGGRTPTKYELPKCYDGNDWRGVSLEEFIKCDHNLAVNRQTRMLADLTLIGCYNKSFMSHSERDIILLASAKENLRRMAFFGLCEFQKISQYLFESVFHLHFLSPFIQLNETHSTLTMNKLSAQMLDDIKRLNHLDIELYEFAKQLLYERLDKMKKVDHNFEYNFENIGTIYAKHKTAELSANIDEIMSDYV